MFIHFIINYHVFTDLYVVGPDLLLEAKTLELTVDGAQVLDC